MIYDIKSDSYHGDTTLPGHEGPASKSLVFQIGSIGGPRVKQVVGFHFTPSQIETKAVADLIEEILIKTYDADIIIPVVTADAGPVNRGAFK